LQSIRGVAVKQRIAATARPHEKETHHETDADQRDAAEERRLAIVDGQKLLDYEIEIEGANSARATSTRPSSPASSPPGSLLRRLRRRPPRLPALQGNLPQYFAEGVSPSQARINDVIREGQELLVQVERKSAATRAPP
jgi:ribonuclease E